MNLENEINNFLLLTFGHEQFSPGLERISRVLTAEIAVIKKAQKNKQIKIITIAGTNGKGETIYELQKLLTENGKKTARWISPHIFSIGERINFGGEDISLLKLKEEIDAAIVALLLKNEQLSYYEFLFFIFCRLCASRIFELDYILLEVGLGGRLDAVNIFDADLVGLTSISRDHQNILGIGYSKILREKMGVVRRHAILISSLELKFLREEIADNGQLHWFDLFASGITLLNDDYTTRNKKLAMALFLLCQQGCILKKDHFVEALAFKLKDFDFLPSGFKGRFEKVTWQGRCFIFIGAHNIDGIRKMAAHSLILKSRIDYIWCSFSKREKEEIKNSLYILKKIAPTYVTPFSHFKASTASDLVGICSDINNGKEKKEGNTHPLFFADDIFATLLAFEKNKIILLCGSYYFIGEVQKIIFESDPPRPHFALGPPPLGTECQHSQYPEL